MWIATEAGGWWVAFTSSSSSSSRGCGLSGEMMIVMAKCCSMIFPPVPECSGCQELSEQPFPALWCSLSADGTPESVVRQRRVQVPAAERWSVGVPESVLAEPLPPRQEPSDWLLSLSTDNHQTHTCAPGTAAAFNG